MTSVATFHFVRIWHDAQAVQQGAPTIQERVLAASEADAVVLIMKKYHLHAAARVWVSRSVNSEPTLRLACVIVKGNKRSWKLEPQMWTRHPAPPPEPEKESNQDG